MRVDNLRPMHGNSFAAFNAYLYGKPVSKNPIVSRSESGRLNPRCAIPESTAAQSVRLGTVHESTSIDGPPVNLNQLEQEFCEHSDVAPAELPG